MILTPLSALKRMVKALSAEKCLFCLVGGHAASLYRSRERFTKDVDFALVASLDTDSRSIAERAIRSIGLKPVIGFIPPGRLEKARKGVCMVTSRPMQDELTGIVDILLPEIPWVKAAVERAQANKLDLGFKHVPVITPEDLIIAKCYALSNSPDRFQDLDDIKELFQNIPDLDIDYLRRKLLEFSLRIPEQLNKFIPPSLKLK